MLIDRRLSCLGRRWAWVRRGAPRHVMCRHCHRRRSSHSGSRPGRQRRYSVLECPAGAAIGREKGGVGVSCCAEGKAGNPTLLVSVQLTATNGSLPQSLALRREMVADKRRQRQVPDEVIGALTTREAGSGESQIVVPTLAPPCRGTTDISRQLPGT